MDAAHGVAGAAADLQESALGGFLAGVRAGGSVVIGRGYDATPMRVSFANSKLKALLAPLGGGGEGRR